jgi:hypothetical protein
MFDKLKNIMFSIAPFMESIAFALLTITVLFVFTVSLKW